MVTSGSFDAAARRVLERELRLGHELRCPICEVVLSVQPVDPGTEVSYVRRRVLVICPECRRSAGLDAKR